MDLSNILVKKTATIKEAMRAIDRAGIRIIIIVDEENRLEGVITDGDVRRGILEGTSIEEDISKIITKNPVYAKEEDAKEDLLALIKKLDLVALPLIDENKIVRDIILPTKEDDLIYLKKQEAKRKNIERVLVIGGAGYIGSVLVGKLLEQDYKVRVLDKFLYGKDSLKKMESNPNLEIIEGDTRHIEDITRSIQEVDAVVHLAELVGDPACELNPSMTHEVNHLATKNIASVCKHFQINRIVYISSCSVYGASEGDDLLSEDSQLNPVSLYAKMKIVSEKALLGLEDDNFSPTILRLGTVFGASFRPRFDLVVNLLTAKAIKEKKITIFGGDQWRPNVHVSDVADTIILTLKSPIEFVKGKIFNVGIEENNSTINQIGKIISQKHLDAEIILDKGKGDERNYKIDFSNLKKIFDLKNFKRIEEGVEEIKELFEKNPDLNHTDSKYSNFQYLKDKNF